MAGNRNYISGRSFEYLTMRKLEKEGYTCSRMAGSHGVYDIIAWNHIQCRFIQVKKQNKPNANIDSLYGDDVTKIKGERVPPNSSKELWVYTARKGYKIYKLD